jgi:hypothetical protein
VPSRRLKICPIFLLLIASLPKRWWSFGRVLIWGNFNSRGLLFRSGHYIRFARTSTPVPSSPLFLSIKLLLNQQIKSRAYDLIDLLLWKGGFDCCQLCSGEWRFWRIWDSGVEISTRYTPLYSIQLLGANYKRKN